MNLRTKDTGQRAGRKTLEADGRVGTKVLSRKNYNVSEEMGGTPCERYLVSTGMRWRDEQGLEHAGLTDKAQKDSDDSLGQWEATGGVSSDPWHEMLLQRVGRCGDRRGAVVWAGPDGGVDHGA